MKKVLLFALIALVGVGCASKKKTVVNKGDVEVIIPCTGKEFMTDKKTFRASGEGFSNSMTIAKDKALQVARQRLAAEINATVKTVIDNYTSSYEMGNTEEAKAKFQGLSRTIVNQELNGAVPVCEKIMKTAEGSFRAYVAIELGGPEVIEKINNSVSNEDKLRIDYEYEKFKKTFEEEMNKME